MASEGETGKFAQRILSIQKNNFSSSSVNLSTDARNFFFFVTSNIRAERLGIASRFIQIFLMAVSLISYCHAMLRLLGGFG